MLESGAAAYFSLLSSETFGDERSRGVIQITFWGKSVQNELLDA